MKPYRSVWHEPTYEPIPRKKGSTFPEYIGHRFPIKGGISLRDVMRLTIKNTNSLLIQVTEPR